MAWTTSERQYCEQAVGQFVERARPPEALRAQVDLAFRLAGQSVELFEVRPSWRDPGQRLEVPVAKATWKGRTAHWQVFWHRADGRWHPYAPTPRVGTIEAFLALVEQDAHACFRG